MFDFKGANISQRRAITTTEGPVLITTGPGTGKTFTLIMRTLYLIKEKGVSPDEIMLATFTEKAANELVSRLADALMAEGIDCDLSSVYVGTFHSICLRIIRENLAHSTLHKNFRVADAFDQQYLVFRHLHAFHELEDFEAISGDRGAWETARVVCALASLITEELIDPTTLLADPDPRVRAAGRAAICYEEILRTENWLDFAHIQREALNLLVDNPDVLAAVHDRVSHLMVDEYQDTNYIQEQLTLTIAGDDHNVCVVGDDDQGLYRFRGATIRNILEFGSKFSGAPVTRIDLTLNYRSDPAIVALYNDWMQTTSGRRFSFDWSRYRFDKAIVAARPKSAGPAATSKLVAGHTPETSWESRIVSTIKGLKDTGAIDDYNQVAFLTTSVKNERVVRLSEALEDEGINVYSPRSAVFFERPEIRLLIGLLASAFPSLLTLLDQDDLPMGDDYRVHLDTCMGEARLFCNQPENLDLERWVASHAETHAHLERATDYAYSGLVYELFQFEPFRSLLDLDASLGVHELRGTHNLSRFASLVTHFEFLHRVDVLTPDTLEQKTKDLFCIYFSYLYKGSVTEYEDDQESIPSGCVPFLTIHQAKGMEFPIVIVNTSWQRPRAANDELEDHIRDTYGHREAFEPKGDIKYFDFWRRYYTAFSRAQDALILTTYETRNNAYFEQLYNRIPKTDLSAFLTDDFDFHKVKQANLKRSLSFTSHVTTYESCPRQYKFYRELGFPSVRAGATLFGRLVHTTIEDVHKAVLTGKEDAITREAISDWFLANYDALSKAEHSYLAPKTLAAAKWQVIRYVERNSGSWDRIVSAEVPVSLVEGDYIIEGTVDLVRGDGDAVEVVDFKTERKPEPGQGSKRLSTYRRQLELYAHLIEEHNACRVSRMHLYYTSETEDDPLISFERDAHAIEECVEGIDATIRSILAKDFEHPAACPQTCLDCDFRFYCGRGTQTRSEASHAM